MLPAPRVRGRRARTVLLAFLVGAAYLAWVQGPAPDMATASAANLRGIGRMERREFRPAELEFADAVRLAPDHLPFRVNHGIALLSQLPAGGKDIAAQVRQARYLFDAVLKRDPRHRHARYCLGMISLSIHVNDLSDAHWHFAAVNDLDPDDPHTWLHLGTTHPDGMYSAAARACYERALGLDPCMNEARYKLWSALRGIDDVRSAALLDNHEKLRKSGAYTKTRAVYSEMGKYAEVIGNAACPTPDGGRSNRNRR